MASDIGVWQPVAGSVIVHSTVSPDVKVTVPVAPVGRPVSAKVAGLPDVMVAEDEPLTVIMKDVGAGVTATEPST